MWSYLSHKLVQIRGIDTLRYTVLKYLGLPSRISIMKTAGDLEKGSWQNPEEGYCGLKRAVALRRAGYPEKGRLAPK